MSSTPTPDTSPIHAVLHGLSTALSQLASQHPWTLVVLALLVASVVVQRLRIVIHSGPRDQLRRFTRADKATLLALAGRRCEHHGWLTGRCSSTDNLEADHVHPWSHGGWTHISNGQILCRAHNREKRASIPWNRTLRKLAERRAAYYPLGTDRTVVRRRPSRRARTAR